jgi:hypothetical protein
MTEQEWLSDTPPEEWLLTDQALKFAYSVTSNRKLRLFAVACGYLIQHLLADERSCLAIVTAERHAEGLATDEDLATTEHNLLDLAKGEQRVGDMNWVRSAAANIATADVVLAADQSLWYSMAHFGADDDTLYLAGLRLRWTMLRDIVGNPFRPVTPERSWLTATMVSLATAIYNERAFDRLPILADALEDAGCTNEEILNHCRQPGEHVRGCWVVDLVLNKN